VPPIRMPPSGAFWTGRLPTVRGVGVEGLKGWAVPSMIRLEGPTEMGVPEMVVCTPIGMV